MSLLLDNDVVYKLTQMDLLDEAIDALGVQHDSVYVLNTLRFHAPRRRMKKRLGEEGVAKVLAFADRVKECEVAASPELLLASEGVDGLDPGELQLLQAMLDSKQKDLMLTGDKNFLTALANTPQLEGVVARLTEQFISFEQIVSALIDRLGFETVRDAVANAAEQSGDGQFDTAIRACFGGLRFAVEANTKDALNAYTRDLRDRTAGLLIAEWQNEKNEAPEEAEEDLLDDFLGADLAPE
ncbi:hypothetical protein [Ferrimonas balearica]|uniref:hypothetical protein n=1 Tax=Ferrimonas balearica TaxID=44012 RepID=UPI001F1A953F|nr:hypothetical protein [Ferrimonas balearica]MBY6096164.1 hypothetical protein [Ferrimonas balearica]